MAVYKPSVDLEAEQVTVVTFLEVCVLPVQQQFTVSILLHFKHFTPVLYIQKSVLSRLFPLCDRISISKFLLPSPTT